MIWPNLPPRLPHVVVWTAILVGLAWLMLS